MSATGFFRMKKLKGPGKILVASRHNKRAIQAERGAGGHIDATRIGLNRSLSGPATPEEVAGLANARMVAANVRPQKKNAVLGIEQIFSLPANTEINPEAYFLDCLEWTATHFGGRGNVLSADVHLDEGAPHMHVLLLPLIDGRMNGSDLFGNLPRLRSLQNDFHGAVAGRYGLSKAPTRLQGRTKETAVKSVIDRLRLSNDPAQKSALWPVIRDAIGRDPVEWAQCLDVQITPAPAKPQRTMAQIFTSKGKGSGKPANAIGFATESNAIGFGKDLQARTLSCVGFAHSPPPETTTEPSAVTDDDRVIDRTDCEVVDWNDT